MATEPYETEAEELEAESRNADRLAAALAIVCRFMDDETRHLIVGPPECQLTVGHIADGALALHRLTAARRPD